MSSGDYTVQHLIPDTYDIKVTVGEFKTFEQTGIVVAANTSPKVDAQLEMGGESETVTVNADTVPELKADRADVSTSFSREDSLGFAFGQPQLYQPSIVAARRATTGLEPRGRRKSSRQPADSNRRSGLRRSGL